MEWKKLSNKKTTRTFSYQLIMHTLPIQCDFSTHFMTYFSNFHGFRLHLPHDSVLSSYSHKQLCNLLSVLSLKNKDAQVNTQETYLTWLLKTS